MTRNLLLVLMVGLAMLAGCEPAPPRTPRPTPSSAYRPVTPSTPAPPVAPALDPARPATPQPGPTVASIRAEPVMRVRIARQQDTVTLEGPTTLRLDAGDAADVQAVDVPAPATVRHTPEGFLITGGDRQTLRWALPALRIRPGSGQSLRVGDTPYAGEVVLHPGRRGLDVVNHVPMEQYLPGVLTKELYGSWDPAAFEALAIAARSYALWEASLSGSRPWDLESTTASQVYGGQTANPKATAAVRQTRGLVLSFGGRVLPAFYCSTIGTTAQDASVIFADRVPELPPLRGGPRPGWDRASPHYRWGPITRDTTTLARRIAAWGRANQDAVADLIGLAAITPVPGPAGRPAAFHLDDSRGRRFTLPAEHLRFAINHNATGLPDLPFAQQVRSSDLVATVRPDVTIFQGHGFGHGVGLSQWGAQAMALQGHQPETILGTYYPGTTLRRLY